MDQYVLLPDSQPQVQSTKTSAEENGRKARQAVNTGARYVAQTAKTSTGAVKGFLRGFFSK